MASVTDKKALTASFKKRLEKIAVSQEGAKKDIPSIGPRIDALIDDAERMLAGLKELRAQKETLKPKGEGMVTQLSMEDFSGKLEKLIEGSMEHLEGRLSERILNMLKDIKASAGAEREYKIRKIREAADDEFVDLSSLFVHDKVESNIGEIGIEEKESKGIDKSLRKLRSMKEKKDNGNV
jgi:hypothetical protein